MGDKEGIGVAVGEVMTRGRGVGVGLTLGSRVENDVAETLNQLNVEGIAQKPIANNTMNAERNLITRL